MERENRWLGFPIGLQWFSEWVRETVGELWIGEIGGSRFELGDRGLKLGDRGFHFGEKGSEICCGRRKRGNDDL